MSPRGKKLVDISFSSSNTVSGASEPSAQLGAAELLAAIPNPIEAEYAFPVDLYSSAEVHFRSSYLPFPGFLSISNLAIDM